MAYNQKDTRKKKVAVALDSVMTILYDDQEGYISLLIENPDSLWGRKPRPEAIQWLVQLVDTYDVYLISHRNRTLGQRREMKLWLKHYMKKELGTGWYRTYRSIKFPWRVPDYDLLIDNRSINARGGFPHMAKLAQEAL